MLELEKAYVKIFFDAPGKSYGFAEVLDENDQPTGEEIFFHLGDGQLVNVIGADEIIWTGAVHPNGARIPAPQQGVVIAFERSPGKGGRDKATPWTFAEGYDNCRYAIGAQVVRIVNDKCVELWIGYHNPDAPVRPVRNISGQLPSELPEGFRVELFVGDDIVDGPYEGLGTIISSHWEEWPQGLHFLQCAMDEASMR